MNTYFDTLQPPTERHRQLLVSARDLVKKFAETNMLMARQLANPFPPYVMGVVVCWASALFLGNGLVAAPNAITVLAHLAGAIAIGSAIFLILELSTPYTGLIRLSPASLDQMIEFSARLNRKTRPRARRAMRMSRSFRSESSASPGAGGDSNPSRRPRGRSGPGKLISAEGCPARPRALGPIVFSIGRPV